MCLGIPGQLQGDHRRRTAPGPRGGVRRRRGSSTSACSRTSRSVPGDWVLIHVGFAMSKIDEEEAALALASLQLMGQAYDDELEAFWDVEDRDSHVNDRRYVMGVIIGVVIGYALGCRAGPEGWAELEDAWHTIYTSEEVRDLVSGAAAIAGEVLEKRAEVIAAIIGSPERSRLMPAA